MSSCCSHELCLKMMIRRIIKKVFFFSRFRKVTVGKTIRMSNDVFSIITKQYYIMLFF